MYRDCPTDPERILDYFNNHNGGIVNQVQPSVDNEVTPLITKIGELIFLVRFWWTFEITHRCFFVKGYITILSLFIYFLALNTLYLLVNEALENSDILGTSPSSSAHGNSGDLGLSSLFNTGDQVLTQSLIQSASGYIGDGLKSLAESITGTKRRRR